MLHKYIDNLGENISNDIRHFRNIPVRILDAVRKLTKQAYTVRSKFGKHREKNSTKSILGCGCAYGKVLQLVIECAIGIKGIVTKHIARLLSLFAKLRHSFRTCLNKRVQFLCGLTEYLHCDSITFGFVFHLTESIDNLPINGVAITHIAFGIINGNTELVISLCHFVHCRGNRLGGTCHVCLCGSKI